MISRAIPTAVRRSLFTRYAAAATVLVLLGIAALLLPRYFGGSEKAVAMEMQQGAQPPTIAPQPKSSEAVTTRSAPVEVTAQPPPAVTQVEKEAPKELPSGKIEDLAVAEERNTPEEVAPLPLAARATTDAGMNVMSSRSRALSQPPQTLRGRVTTEDGRPIAGATINRQGMPLEVTTDSSGQFMLSHDATLSELQIRHPAFEDESLTLIDPQEFIQISLSEKVSDQRMDRFKQAVARQQAGLAPAPAERGGARPVGGLSALREKLENGRPATLPSGKVRVNFLVALDGTLSDFRFRGQPDRQTMDYVGSALVESSTWNVVGGTAPVRVYLKLRF